MTTTLNCCDWCGTPLDGNYLDDHRHPGCGDPLQTLAATVPAEALGPCAVCGVTTVRYGDHAPSTLCPLCCEDVTPRD